MRVSDIIDDCEIILVEKGNEEYPWKYHFYELTVGSFAVGDSHKVKVYLEKGKVIKNG